MIEPETKLTPNELSKVSKEAIRRVKRKVNIKNVVLMNKDQNMNYTNAYYKRMEKTKMEKMTLKAILEQQKETKLLVDNLLENTMKFYEEKYGKLEGEKEEVAEASLIPLKENDEGEQKDEQDTPSIKVDNNPLKMKVVEDEKIILPPNKDEEDESKMMGEEESLLVSNLVDNREEKKVEVNPPNNVDNVIISIPQVDKEVELDTVSKTRDAEDKNIEKINLPETENEEEEIEFLSEKDENLYDKEDGEWSYYPKYNSTKETKLKEEKAEQNYEELKYCPTFEPSLCNDNGGDDEEENEDDEDEDAPCYTGNVKKSFNEIQKKEQFSSSEYDDEEEHNYKPGKLNKNFIFSLIVLLFIIFLSILTFLSFKKKKEGKQAKEKTEKVMVGDFNVDFGDYKSREYKPSKEEEELQNLKEVESLLTTEKKEEYKPERVEVVQTVPKKQSYYNSLSVEEKEDIDKANQSTLRYSGEGFGITATSSSYNEPSSSSPYYRGGVPHMSEEDIANRYMDRVETVSKDMGFNSATVEGKDEHRYSSRGMYDPTKSGGDISDIPDYSLYPSTVISAVLVSGINTDYPGNITARVISNVYDSKTGQHLLIPSGSILRGSYSSSSIGINRIQIAWETLIINRDGKDYLVNLGNMVGIDKAGYSGIKGSLNEHWFSYLKASGMASLFTVMNSSMIQLTTKQTNPIIKDLLSQTGDIGKSLTDKMLDRALDIQPTVNVKPGTRISVDVDKVLTLFPHERDNVDKYKIAN